MRAEALDMDYIHKLSPDEKEFLNSFIEETVNANFNHKGKKLIKKTKSKAFNRDMRKKIYDDNNARNADVYTRKRAMGEIIFLGEKTNMHTSPADNFNEDYVIEKIDKELTAEKLFKELDNMEYLKKGKN